MKRIASLLLLLAVASPAAAQPWEADARARGAELDAWGARYEAQAAEAARYQAEARQRLRTLQMQRDTRPTPRVEQQTALRLDAADYDTASRQSADARRRELDARLREMDAWLDATRPH